MSDKLAPIRDSVMNEPLLVSPKEAGRMLSVGTTIYQLIERGELPVVRLGFRGIRIPVEALRKYVQENTEPRDRRNG